MAQLRKKEFESDGIKVTIGELSLEQVEELMTPARPADDLKGWDRQHVFDVKTFAIVRTSFQNAGNTEEWPDERLRKEFGRGFLNMLTDEIARYSGLNFTSNLAGETLATPSK